MKGMKFFLGLQHVIHHKATKQVLIREIRQSVINFR